MEVNISELSEIKNVDFCVIGSGPAGLTCALRLAAAGQRVLIAEGGGQDFSKESQELYQGQVTGDPYFPLDVCRLRYFGGTSNHWNGWCRPLDGVDFRGKRADQTGKWPITKADLDPYLNEARSILELPGWQDDLELEGSGLKLIAFSFSPPVRFKEKYLEKVRASQNIILCLNCNLVNFEYGGNSVQAAVFASPSGALNRFKARKFVLCTGGIENSRLLAWSNMLSGGGLLGDSAVNVGTRWMEHPHFLLGDAVVATQWHLKSGAPDTQFFAPTEALMKRDAILNCGLRLEINPDVEQAAKVVQDLAATAPKLSDRVCSQFQAGRLCVAKLRAAWEQEQTVDSRITLSAEKDRFGIPRVKLHWKKVSRDFLTPRKTAEALGAYLARSDLGRLRLNDWLLRGETWPADDWLGGNHHLGGTRMGVGPRDSVVDSNLKLFYCSNAYVLGSSVFPSGGHANPTLTIVQLALRLADHLVT